jgi:hypothetical protein
MGRPRAADRRLRAQRSHARSPLVTALFAAGCGQRGLRSAHP